MGKQKGCLPERSDVWNPSDMVANGLWTQDSDAGVVFAVKAHASAPCNSIAGLHNGALRVKVTAAPERGKANKAIVRLLARALGLAPSRLRVVGGVADSHKKVLAEGVDSITLCRTLQPVVTEIGGRNS